MEELINNKEAYLNVSISNRALIDKINGLLSQNDIKLPQLSNAMFTRLKKQVADTPQRRNALRSFAFWIGYNRTDMGKAWHYEALKDLCRGDTDKAFYNSCGVRIAFSIDSRGNKIGQDIVTWMKRTIKNTLREREDLLGNRPKVKNHDLTTIQLDLPNIDQSRIPAAYANSLKKAITLAHQIAIRWMISEFAACNQIFSIGIAAGDFDEVNNPLQAIVNAKLPEDPVIRLTDYARQCALINQIKIILNHKPAEIEWFGGEAFKVWWIIEFSGVSYWDLVPGIVSERSLETDNLNVVFLKRQLTIPSETISRQNNDAINCFLKFPNHPMLGFEIVRVLFCKKKFSEALELLNALLRVTPQHLNSRITRMMLYKFIGIEAPDYYLSEMFFRMAESETGYILENFNYIGEDFYYEYANLKLAKLSTAIKTLRQQDGNTIEMMDTHFAASDLITLVNQAEEIIIRGITVSSPTVERIIYLFLSVQVLKLVLFENTKDDGRLNSRLACPNDKIKQHMFGVFISLYQQVLTLGAADLNRAQQFIIEIANQNESLIALEVFKPAHYFNTALFYWDILPVRTVAILGETLRMLRKSLNAAKACALKEEFIYSIANMSGQFVPADEFISQINSIIKEIEKRYQKASVLEKMDPTAVIGQVDDDLVLLTYAV